MDIFKIIKTADRLTGYNLTEKGSDNKSKQVKRIFDKPLCGTNADKITAGATATIIDQNVDPGRTLVFIGMLGKGLDGTLITVKGEDETPIIQNVIGDLIGLNKEMFPFTCPHVVKPGSRYKVQATNDTTADITAKTVKMVVFGVKLTWN